MQEDSAPHSLAFSSLCLSINDAYGNNLASLPLKRYPRIELGVETVKGTSLLPRQTILPQISLQYLTLCPPSLALQHVVPRRLHRRLDLRQRARVPCRTALS